MRNRIGRPRFNQGPASGRGASLFSFGDAPMDGESYGRQDGAWVEVVEEAPNDGTLYGRQNETWQPVVIPAVAPALAFIGDAPPSSPVVGQLWFESDSGHMYIYFDATWVPVTTTPYLPAVAAPVLELLTDGTDTTPDFTLSGDLAEDDVIRFQYSTAIDFTGTSELTHTIDAAEDAANAFSLSTGALALDTWYFRARIERVGRPSSDWSNVETIEITGTGVSPEVSQFLARTTGLDTTHSDACEALIDGLVTDGVWSKIDVLYIFATQNETNALLNLKSSSYTPTKTGAITFTTDRGYTNNFTAYIDTNFNASTAGGNYTRDNAHIAAWQVADVGGVSSMTIGASGGLRQYIGPNYGGGFSGLFRINTGAGLGAAVPDGAGFTLANRSSVMNIEGYHNATQVGFTTADDATPFSLNNSNFTIPYQDFADGAAEMSAISLGGSLTPTQAAALYNRLRTYMTVVGVP